jgi:hypothetical protein
MCLLNAASSVLQGTFDGIDQDIEATKKDLKDGLRQKVEAVKKGIKERKDGLRQRVETAKKEAKDRASKEAGQALNSMEEDLSKGDLVNIP